MIEMDSVILENNIEYIVLEKIEIKGITYLILSNVNDDKDIKIGKNLLENGQKYFCGIDDDEEFKMVLEAFNSKLNQ